MKAKLPVENTYLGHLDKLHYLKSRVDKEQVAQMLRQLKELADSSYAFIQSPVYFAIDYTARNYLFFSGPLGHHRAEEIIEGGLDRSLELMPPDYLKTHNEKVFPALLAFLQEKKEAAPVVSFNHRMLGNGGKPVDTYQRCKYILCPETGLPTHCLGTAVNISGISSNTLNISFESVNTTNGQMEPAGSFCFFPGQEKIPLSVQEKKVLGCLAAGLSSRQIAAKLFISEKTVSNHRNNILRKTNTKNTAHLMAFARENNLAS